MLTCQEMVELVTDYLERRMPPALRLRFLFHLAGCRRCRAYLEQMQLTVRTLGRLPDEPMPKPVEDELLIRFRKWKASG